MIGGWSLLVPVGPDTYAIPADKIREIVRGPRLTSLPTAPPLVVGLFNLRGEIVPLFDTAALLGTGTRPAAPFAAVLHTALGPVGLAASASPESVVLGVPIGPSEGPGTAGVFAHGARLVVLIDVDFLLAAERIGSGDHQVVPYGALQA